VTSSDATFKTLSTSPAAFVSLTDEDFQLFRSFFYHVSGIQYSNAQRYYVDKRLIARLKVTGESSVSAYLNELKSDPLGEEMNELIHLMTVKQTYFFREKYQFECLVHSILPEYVNTRSGDKAIRIWSIPSSSGDEPYSIAIYLKEFWRELARYGVEITGSDLDERILEVARQGQYAKPALQALPENLLRKYFTERPYGGYEVNKEIKALVKFSTANIHQTDLTQKFHDFDVIFCRNLLIYFDDASRKKAIHKLFNALKPGGLLCLGHSESLSRIESEFEIRRFEEALVYQKPKP
jgi:chemotaxis protein methyltransferase CheR